MQMVNWCTFERFKDIQEERSFTQNWWITCRFHTSGNNSSATWVARETDIPLRKLDRCQEVKKAKKEDKQFSSHLLIHTTVMPAKQRQLQISSKPRKVHYQSYWRPEQDALYWIFLSRAQDYGLKYCLANSITRDHFVQAGAECVETVVSENGGRELFTRQLTPRPGPKVTFRNTCVKSDSSTSNQLR